MCDYHFDLKFHENSLVQKLEPNIRGFLCGHACTHGAMGNSVHFFSQWALTLPPCFHKEAHPNCG